jgi:hypothetical protein
MTGDIDNHVDLALNGATGSRMLITWPILETTVMVAMCRWLYRAVRIEWGEVLSTHREEVCALVASSGTRQIQSNEEEQLFPMKYR